LWSPILGVQIREKILSLDITIGIGLFVVRHSGVNIK
jgi:hypothetical protein